MKLLMITGHTALAEGRKSAFYNTLDELRKHWDRIDIICPHIESSSANFFQNVFFHPSPWPKIYQPFWILKKGKEIYRREKFDVFVLNDYPPFYNGMGAFMLSFSIPIPYLLEIHHITGYPKAANFKEVIYRLFAFLFLRFDSWRSKVVRVVNNKQLPRFLIRAGVPRDKIRYIPSIYINFDLFKKINVEKKYDLIFIARLVSNKGLDLLINSIKLAREKKPDLSCYIVGTGPREGWLREQIKKNNLESNILQAGWLSAEDIVMAINQSRALVMTSYNEGGPRVVAEALACGLPVIATAVGMVEDLIKEGENGHVVSWQPSDISERIICVLNNIEQYQAENCIKTVLGFERSKVIERYAREIKDLVI